VERVSELPIKHPRRERERCWTFCRAVVPRNSLCGPICAPGAASARIVAGHRACRDRGAERCCSRGVAPRGLIFTFTRPRRVSILVVPHGPMENVTRLQERQQAGLGCTCFAAGRGLPKTRAMTSIDTSHKGGMSRAALILMLRNPLAPLNRA
jgi:hypothetical protein